MPTCSCGRPSLTSATPATQQQRVAGQRVDRRPQAADLLVDGGERLGPRAGVGAVVGLLRARRPGVAELLQRDEGQRAPLEVAGEGVGVGRQLVGAAQVDARDGGGHRRGPAVDGGAADGVAQRARLRAEPGGALVLRGPGDGRLRLDQPDRGDPLLQAAVRQRGVDRGGRRVLLGRLVAVLRAPAPARPRRPAAGPAASAPAAGPRRARGTGPGCPRRASPSRRARRWWSAPRAPTSRRSVTPRPGPTARACASGSTSVQTEAGHADDDDAVGGDVRSPRRRRSRAGPASPAGGDDGQQHGSPATCGSHDPTAPGGPSSSR